ncbi:flagellar biosynthetic protein FliO [Pigmentiphaga sp. GD03639]|uniref:Flagellar protein n=1 Tax=Pigmentiphaga daeguensis TaxID=414049 RepID=A0ABP3L5T4_9BURK|nr:MULTISPECIES: flagellar biosynthetic protein FliO [unclassified Pigmentiphaga]MDH2237679.1 flagellar biosynthetic protein FliO [Pigmentiphaga sp. GD03639]OVZ62210.1 flagellar biosynthetic protein FliO [Pigmentiphaga sp. NML030171]
MISPGSTLQTVLALIAVLALIMACAWLLRRVQRPQGGGDHPLRLRGQLTVGPRERVILVEVADQWIVAGVSAGNVRPLAVLPRPGDAPPADSAPAAPLPDFRALLARFGKQ